MRRERKKKKSNVMDHKLRKMRQENKWSFIIMVKSPNHKVFLKFCYGVRVVNTLTDNLGKGLCRRRQHL